jgi:hypothetical protein
MDRRTRFRTGQRVHDQYDQYEDDGKDEMASRCVHKYVRNRPDQLTHPGCASCRTQASSSGLGYDTVTLSRKSGIASGCLAIMTFDLIASPPKIDRHRN